MIRVPFVRFQGRSGKRKGKRGNTIEEPNEGKTNEDDKIKINITRKKRGKAPIIHRGLIHPLVRPPEAGRLSVPIQRAWGWSGVREGGQRKEEKGVFYAVVGL